MVTALSLGGEEYEAKDFYEAIATLKVTSPLSHTKLITNHFFHHSPEQLQASTQVKQYLHRFSFANPRICLHQEEEYSFQHLGELTYHKN